VKPVVAQYTAKDIFDLDETALVLQCTIKDNSSIKEEKCRGNVTILCCSAGGEKLRPLIIRQFEKPRYM
jgi:hypothetical protein